MRNFETLLKLMPPCLLYDHLAHKTVEDLRFLAQHELDLYAEGEDSDIKNAKDRASVRQFLIWCGGAY